MISLSYYSLSLFRQKRQRRQKKIAKLEFATKSVSYISSHFKGVTPLALLQLIDVINSVDLMLHFFHPLWSSEFKSMLLGARSVVT